MVLEQLPEHGVESKRHTGQRGHVDTIHGDDVVTIHCEYFIAADSRQGLDSLLRNRWEQSAKNVASDWFAWVSLCWSVVSCACVCVLIPCGEWCAHILSLVAISLWMTGTDGYQTQTDGRATGEGWQTQKRKGWMLGQLRAEKLLAEAVTLH